MNCLWTGADTPGDVAKLCILGILQFVASACPYIQIRLDRKHVYTLPIPTSARELEDLVDFGVDLRGDFGNDVECAEILDDLLRLRSTNDHSGHLHKRTSYQLPALHLGKTSKMMNAHSHS